MKGGELKINKNAIIELQNLLITIKFGPEEQSGYVGLLPEENQPQANKLLNESIERIISILKDDPKKERILTEYKIGLNSLDDIATDTEDRERVCEYYDQIREIIGFDTTDEILNDWLW